VIREDRELLAGLARLNSDMVPLAMKMMDGSATADEQYSFSRRLVALGERLGRRADATGGMVVDGEVPDNKSIILPAYTIESSAGNHEQ
jgi:hypothetical protein